MVYRIIAGNKYFQINVSADKNIHVFIAHLNRNL